MRAFFGISCVLGVQNLTRFGFGPVLFAFIIGFGLISCSPETNADVTEQTSNSTQNEQKMRILSRPSSLDFSTTIGALRIAMAKREFRVFAEMDHQSGAKTVEQELRPTTLMIFGNPRGGTPLMQASQNMGLALPLKILVHEDENGQVHMSWYNMEDIFEAHGVTGLDANLEKIKTVLEAIVSEAGGQ